MNYTWNLKLLYKSKDDPQIEIDIERSKREVEKFVQKWKTSKEFTKDPSVLANLLTDYEKLLRENNLADKPLYYFSLFNALNEDDTEILARINKIEDVSVKLANKLEFISLEIGKIPQSLQNEFLEYPKLKEFKHFLEKIFKQSKYFLSEKEEQILNLLSKTSSSNWIDMVSEFINSSEESVLNEKREKVRLPFNHIIGLLSSQKKDVRDSCAKATNKILKKYLPVATKELNSILEAKRVKEDLRKIERPDLTRHLSDDIDTEIVDALIETVTNNFGIANEYYKLKAKLLGVKQLAYHERVVQYGKLPSEIPYEKAKDIVLDSYRSLDNELYELAQDFFKQGRIDAFPKAKKHGGAFCVAHSISTPVYILQNYTGKFTDVTTIAHELGHGINDELMKEAQNEINFGIPKSTAEVASTFFENFAVEQMTKEFSKKEQLSILMARLDDDISTIFRQVALYNFEKELHKLAREKGYLSGKELGKLFLKHMKSYMGEAVEMSKGSENWWVYWGHIRRFFYVYSYASGLLISKSLQEMVREDERNIKKIKTFLSTGYSKSPKDVFMEMGVDISRKDFWEKGIEEIKKELKYAKSLAE